MTARMVLMYLSIATLAGCSADAPLTGLSDEHPLDSSPDLSTAEVTPVSGQEQSGVVGSILPDPLVVEVIAADGAPIVGAPVQWIFTAGRGLTDPDMRSEARTQVIRMETDAEGRAQIWWELGTRQGEQTATVSIIDTASNSVSGGPSGAPGGNGKGKMLGLIAKADPGPVYAIDVIPDVAAVEIHDALRLEAVVTDAYGNVIEGAEVAWSSSDDAVTTVDSTGLLDPSAVGEATVTASSAEVTDEATITIVPETATSVTAPHQVTDLRVNSVSNSSVTLQWTAVDDGTGSGAKYALRVGSPSISWGEASTLQVLVDGIRHDSEPSTSTSGRSSTLGRRTSFSWSRIEGNWTVRQCSAIYRT
jgi:hypothetical protein